MASLFLSLVCSADLLAHSIASLRARGVSVIAILGIVGAALLVACGATPAAAIAFGWHGAVRAFAYIAGSCSVWFSLSVLALNVHSARHRSDPDSSVDFIIVPGAALRGAAPSPILEARLDRALELWDSCGCHAHFVVSGGQGADECISEAGAMKTYLLDHNVPADLIWTEARSTTTQENMRLSLELLKNKKSFTVSSTVAVVSTDYHLARCLHYARKCGLHAKGVGASSAGHLWSRGYLREVAAFTKMLLPSYIFPVAAGILLHLHG